MRPYRRRRLSAPLLILVASASSRCHPAAEGFLGKAPVPCFAPPRPNLASKRRPVVRRPSTAVHVLKMGLGDAFRNFGKELDKFIDDAMDRKLAGGSTFYGERKSNFSTSKKSYEGTSRWEAAKREAARPTAEETTADAGGSNRRDLGGSLTGEELRGIIFEKWGEEFPVLIKRRRDALGEFRLFLIVQWKFLGKTNLNLSRDEYVAESDAVAEFLTEWGVANQVKNYILESNDKPKTMTQQYPGLFIALDVADQGIVDTW